MKIIDVKGMPCPMPLIKTKKALQEMEQEESLKVILDNDSSVSNVLHFLSDNNLAATYTKQGKITEVTVNKTDIDLEAVVVEEYCEISTPPTNNFVLLFSKDSIGEGSRELGKILTEGFLNTFNEMDKLPQKILFLNSGVLLSLKDSPVLDVLQEYERKGVELLVCGTCLEFYNKMNEIAVGRVSNAYDIINASLNADKTLSY